MYASWMKVPVATVLFIGSVAMLVATNSPLKSLNGTLGAIVAMACIGCMVLSFTLYSNLDIIRRP